MMPNNAVAYGGQGQMPMQMQMAPEMGAPGAPQVYYPPGGMTADMAVARQTMPMNAEQAENLQAQYQAYGQQPQMMYPQQ